MFTTAMCFGERAALWQPVPEREPAGNPGLFLPVSGGSVQEQCRTARRCTVVRATPARVLPPGPVPTWPPQPEPGDEPGSPPANPVASAVLELDAWRAAVLAERPGPDLARLLAARPDVLAPRDRRAHVGQGTREPDTDRDGSRHRAASPRIRALTGADAAAIGSVPDDDTLEPQVITCWGNGVVDGMQARQRLMSHLQAEQYLDAAALQARYPGPIDWLPSELSLAWGITENTASNLLHEAHRFGTVLTRTLAALHAGEINIDVAQAILSATANCTDEVAKAAEAAVLASLAAGGSRTYHAVRARVSKAIIAADPDGAIQRHRKAAGERRMTRWAENDGMAGLNIYAPAQDVAAIWDCATALADGARTPGDTRDLGNRRVDAVADLCRRILTDGGTRGLFGLADGADLPRRHGVRPHIQVTMPIDALLGGDSPCELSGYGPISAEQARQIAADGELRRLLCDPVSGALLDYGRTRYRPPRALADFVAARDQTCPFPGCRHPAGRGDFDHVRPARPDPVTGRPTHGTTSADNGARRAPPHR